MFEMMDFPDTVEEFMEQYKVTDTKQIYSNGTEYVPIFRMRQWFDHIHAAPVIHGRWIEKPFLMGVSRFCSKCGDNFGMPHGVYRYCPNCGAKMDLKEAEDA